MSLNQVRIVPRLLRFKEAKREQTLTIENNTGHEISYEFSAATYQEEAGKVITLFQSNLPNGRIKTNCKEEIIIQYVGSFTKKETEKAEVLQVLLDGSPHFSQTITVDCEFESDQLDNGRNQLNNQKTEDDLNKIVNILNLDEDDRKKGKLATINEILRPLSPKFKSKKLRNLTFLTVFIFLISLAILSFSVYIAFLNGYDATFKQIIAFYGLERIVKLCLEDSLYQVFTFGRSNWTNSANFYSTNKLVN